MVRSGILLAVFAGLCLPGSFARTGKIVDNNLNFECLGVVLTFLRQTLCRVKRMDCRLAIFHHKQRRFRDRFPMFVQFIQGLRQYDNRRLRKRFVGPVDVSQGVNVTAVVLRPGLVVAGVSRGPQPLAVGRAA